MNSEKRAVSLIRRGAFDRYYFQKRIRIVGLGPRYRFGDMPSTVHNWTLREIDQETSSARTLLPEVANIAGVKELFAPRPTKLNAQVCSQEELMDERLVLRRDGHELTFNRGAYADGLVLKPGQAFGVSAAGCSLIVLWSLVDELVGVAHAGRESLIDERRHLHHGVRRAHESVVFPLVHALTGGNPAKIAQLRGLILFSAPAKILTYPWNHPEFGEVNRSRSEWVGAKWGPECTPGQEDSHRNLGLIDLDALIRAQLISRGMLPARIKKVSLPHGWHTTRGEYPRHRNFYLVTFD